MEHSTARILLVDDDPSLLKMMGVYLGRLGYSVTLANSTEQAWEEAGRCLRCDIKSVALLANVLLRTEDA